MILVDIYAPAIDSSFDFNLDENVQISMLLDEIGEMIARATQNGNDNESEAEVGNLMLWDADRRCILNSFLSLSENGITNGTRLLVV